MRSRSADRREGDERGSVTAEFAIALPAVALVLACCLSGLQLASQQVRLQDAAALAARSAARGDGTGVAARLAPGAALEHWADGPLECVRLTAQTSGVLLPVTLAATGCALGGGR